MAVTNLFIKVQVDHDDKEPPQKLAEQICRQIRKVYGVRSAELSNVSAADE